MDTKSIPKRYFIAFLAFFGYMFIDLIQESLASAFIDMRANKTFNYTDEQDEYEVIQIMQANTLGFMVTFIGGCIANTYGGATTFGTGIGLSACIAILSPSLAKAPIEWIMRVKYLDGLLQGLAYCGVADLWARWSLLEERARLVAFAMTGTYFGSVIQQVVGIIGRNHILPYSTIFTITGSLAGIWSIIWLLYVRSDPSKDESISECERARLAYRIKYVGTKRVPPEDYPWMEIITSKPVWAIFVASFLNSCGFSVASAHLPDYMLEAKLVDENTYKRIPLIMDTFTAVYWFPAGYLCDWARSKWHPTKVHKCFVCSGLLTAAFLLFTHVLVGKVTFMLWFFYTIYPLAMVSCDLAFMVNVIDISPRYASLISGFEITFFTTGSLLGNYLVRHMYNKMVCEMIPFLFIGYGVLFCCGAILYYFWANTKLQAWNQLPIEEHVNLRKRQSVFSKSIHV